MQKYLIKYQAKWFVITFIIIVKDLLIKWWNPKADLQENTDNKL